MVLQLPAEQRNITTTLQLIRFSLTVHPLPLKSTETNRISWGEVWLSQQPCRGWPQAVALSEEVSQLTVMGKGLRAHEAGELWSHRNGVSRLGNYICTETLGSEILRMWRLWKEDKEFCLAIARQVKPNSEEFDWTCCSVQQCPERQRWSINLGSWLSCNQEEILTKNAPILICGIYQF